MWTRKNKLMLSVVFALLIIMTLISAIILISSNGKAHVYKGIFVIHSTGGKDDGYICQAC